MSVRPSGRAPGFSSLHLLNGRSDIRAGTVTIHHRRRLNAPAPSLASVPYWSLWRESTIYILDSLNVDFSV